MEGQEPWAASDAVALFSEKHAAYARFIALVLYSQGLRAFFLRSPLLRSGMRVLDAGCGTGAATLALHDAFLRRALTPTSLHAFDLTPAMLQRLHETLQKRQITSVETRQADVLDMDTLPTAWTNYDLVVSASMLEYVPRRRLAEALGGLRARLADGGRLVVLITKRNWLTRLMIGWWWQSNVYGKRELRDAFERAGFSQVTFKTFPFVVQHLAVWGYVIEARK